MDRWYADFNITFTYERPTEGVFDTIIMSSEGAWCLADDRTTTYSPLPKCIDAGGGPVVVFKCGDAKACASLIAKEQGHLLGLGHTTGVRDVMNENSTEHDGFEDFQNSVTSAQCSLGQNSYRLMLERLGPWSGGPKPAPREPVVTEVDAGVPPPSIADAEVPPSPEDGMAGTDAADERPNPPKSSGCAVGGGSEPIGGGAAFAVAFVPYWFARRRRRPAPHQVSIKRT